MESLVGHQWKGICCPFTLPGLGPHDTHFTLRAEVNVLIMVRGKVRLVGIFPLCSVAFAKACRSAGGLLRKWVRPQEPLCTYSKWRTGCLLSCSWEVYPVMWPGEMPTERASWGSFVGLYAAWYPELCPPVLACNLIRFLCESAEPQEESRCLWRHNTGYKTPPSGSVDPRHLHHLPPLGIGFTSSVVHSANILNAMIQDQP